MKNIKSFDQFNEGVLSNLKKGISKFFKPGEVGDIVENIFSEIQENFDMKKFKMTEVYSKTSNTIVRAYHYTFPDADSGNIELKLEAVYVMNRDVTVDLYLNNEVVTDLVNKYIIDDIYEFFNKKNKKKEDKGIDRVGSIRGKYRKYSNDIDPKDIADSLKYPEAY